MMNATFADPGSVESRYGEGNYFQGQTDDGRNQRDEQYTPPRHAAAAYMEGRQTIQDSYTRGERRGNEDPDKLPLVSPTRMNDSPNHLYTEVDSNHLMDAPKSKKVTVPTNSKALTMSAVMESIAIAMSVMSVMSVDMLTNPKDDDPTPIDTSVRRKVDKAMGLKLTLDPVTSIVTLRKLTHTAARGPTRATMTSTE